VEDACQAPGAMLQGKMAGAWGDVGVMSFGGSKLLTAGRGARSWTPTPMLINEPKSFASAATRPFRSPNCKRPSSLRKCTSLPSETGDATAAVARLLQKRAGCRACDRSRTGPRESPATSSCLAVRGRGGGRLPDR